MPPSEIGSQRTSPPLRLVILDRDDTLICVPPGRRYIYGDDEIVLANGAAPFLRALKSAGVSVVIATNQQGIALPEYASMTAESVALFHRRMLEELQRQQAVVERVYVCPHAAAANCACRKPRPELFLRALNDFGVSPDETAAIGDRPRDVQAARAAGIRARYLIKHRPSQAEPRQEFADTRVFDSFEECLDTLLSQAG